MKTSYRTGHRPGKAAQALAGALLLATAATCQRHGVCDDVAGSCLALRVEGEGPFDALRTTLNLTGAPPRIGDTEGIELPVTLRVVPPPGVSASQVRGVEVAGLRGGAAAETAASDSSFFWPDDSHIDLTLQLHGPEGDKDGGTEDMAEPDMAPPAGMDMAPTMDMPNPTPTLKWSTEMNSARANLYSVWAGSATQAFAVGASGVVLSRQGDGTWRTESLGALVNLAGVTGVPGSSAWAVGQSPGAWRRDSMKWSQDTSGLALSPGMSMNGQLWSIAAGATAGELWAGDRDGRVFHRTGPANGAGSWQSPEQVFPSGTNIYGVSSAGGAVFAVGDNGQVAVRKDSAPMTRWQTFQYSLPAGGSLTLNSVWAFDKDSAVAVGVNGLLVRYSGGAWQATPQSVDAQNTELFAVWGLRPDRVWAVGDNGLIVRVDGTRTVELAKNAAQSLRGIHGLSEVDIYIVGFTTSASLILHGTP